MLYFLMVYLCFAIGMFLGFAWGYFMREGIEQERAERLAREIMKLSLAEPKELCGVDYYLRRIK